MSSSENVIWDAPKQSGKPIVVPAAKGSGHRPPRDVERIGPREFLRIALDRYDLDSLAGGWAGFYVAERVLRKAGVTSDQLEWRYAEENSFAIVAIFEVFR